MSPACPAHHWSGVDHEVFVIRVAQPKHFAHILSYLQDLCAMTMKDQKNSSKKNNQIFDRLILEASWLSPNEGAGSFALQSPCRGS